MKLNDLRRAIKNGKIIKLKAGDRDYMGTHIALYGTFLKYIQEEELKKFLTFQYREIKDQVTTFREFCDRARKTLPISEDQNPLFSLQVISPNSDMSEGTEVLYNTTSPQKLLSQVPYMSLHVPAEERIIVEIDDDLWQETFEFIKKHLQDFLDHDTGNLDIPFWLWRLGLIDEKNPPLEGEKKKHFKELISFWGDFKRIHSFMKRDSIIRVLQFKKLRYRVQHDAIKIAVSARKKHDSPYIELLKNGHIENIKYYLDEDKKKPLGLYHYMALFDLILRLIRKRKIHNQFAVAKSNQKIPEEYKELIITNETIRELLGVSDYDATQIKNAIYDLSQLVIVFEKKDGTKVGIFPIRRRGFLEKTEERFDFFEIDTIFLHNGKNFIPMIPNSFTRLQGLKAPSRTKEFITNVFLYLLKARNFSSNKCYISARSFSEVFPNSYSKYRKWSALHEKIKEALQYLYEIRLITAYREQQDYFEVKLRN